MSYRGNECEAKTPERHGAPRYTKIWINTSSIHTSPHHVASGARASPSPVAPSAVSRKYFGRATRSKRRGPPFHAYGKKQHRKQKTKKNTEKRNHRHADEQKRDNETADARRNFLKTRKTATNSQKCPKKGRIAKLHRRTSAASPATHHRSLSCR